MIRNHIVYNPVVDWRFQVSKAENEYLWDDKDNKYIDFSSGWNTTNLGWNNPEINKAVAEQTSKNVYVPMWTSDEIQVRYADALTSAFPKELDCVMRATGGTEANEMALKVVRAVTGRKKIVSFKHSYHGQSFGTIALGFIPDYVKRIEPLVPEFIQLDYPDVYRANVSQEELLEQYITGLEEILKAEDVAAVFTEPGLITGWGSMLVAPKGYLTRVREVTQKYGTLLVVDEVGSGFSRTGKLFGIEHEQVVPDVITLAKGISNGAASIGAVVTKSNLIQEILGHIKPTSTFGWTPLACAAALKNLKIHQRDQVWLEAERKGNWVKETLQKELVEHSKVGDIRGKGLEIAIDMVKDKQSKAPYGDANSAILEEAFSHGLHLADAGDCTQIMPPLTISQEALEQGISILIEAIKKVK